MSALWRFYVSKVVEPRADFPSPFNFVIVGSRNLPPEKETTGIGVIERVSGPFNTRKAAREWIAGQQKGVHLG